MLVVFAMLVVVGSGKRMDGNGNIAALSTRTFGAGRLPKKTRGCGRKGPSTGTRRSPPCHQVNSFGKRIRLGRHLGAAEGVIQSTLTRTAEQTFSLLLTIEQC